LNDKKSGNAKLKPTKNAALYRISISAHNQFGSTPLLQNTRFSDPCLALTILGVGCIFCRSTMYECFPNEAKQNAVMADHLWSLGFPEHHCL